MRRQRECAEVLIGICQGGEDLSADTEIRVTHVRLLLGTRQRDGRTTKLVRSHDGRVSGGNAALQTGVTERRRLV